ncbi:MAG: D-Ala-D-Ala carboxypeptidase family metallohydrolase, partial [Candidimonas sp.]
RVYIEEFGGDPDDERNWHIVSYLSPFAGATNPYADFEGNRGNVKNGTEMEDTQQSYGWWAIPPDKGVDVLVGFANGNPHKGFWLGCIYHQYMNHMVPGLASGNSFQEPKQDGGFVPPVSEYNRFRDSRDAPNADSYIRPEYRPLHEGLARQGLLADSLRGISTSSARRENISRVLGLLSPGGNQFVMDDNPTGQLIRLRTKSGTQILLSETHGHVYAISRDGKTWIELNNDGHVDIYGSKSISLSADVDINMRAGRDVNIEAERAINVKTNQSDIKVLSTGKIHRTALRGIYDSTDGDFRTSVAGEYSEDAALIHMNSGRGVRAEEPEINELPDNNIITSSITTRVPEREPWPVHTVRSNPGLRGTAANVGPLPTTTQDEEYEGEGDRDDGNCGISEPISGLRTSNRGKLLIAASREFTSFVRDGRLGYDKDSTESAISYDDDRFKYGETENESWKRFEQIISNRYERQVKSTVREEITQQEFDSLVAMVANGESINELASLINGGKIKDARNSAESMGIYGKLFSRCIYGSIADRCEQIKNNYVDATKRYSSETINVQKQIQGSLYRMGMELPSEDFISEIQKKYGTEIIYDGACGPQENQISECDTSLKISKYFTLGDLIASTSAERNGISNCPEDEFVLRNLRSLATNVLDAIVDGFGPIRITSGYRGPKLNSIVGGSGTSQHVTGQAVDIQPRNGKTTYELAIWIRDNLQYDQLINELGTSGSRWVHVSYRSNGNRQPGPNKNGTYIAGRYEWGQIRNV